MAGGLNSRGGAGNPDGDGVGSSGRGGLGGGSSSGGGRSGGGGYVDARDDPGGGWGNRPSSRGGGGGYLDARDDPAGGWGNRPSTNNGNGSSTPSVGTAEAPTTSSRDRAREALSRRPDVGYVDSRDDPGYSGLTGGLTSGGWGTTSTDPVGAAKTKEATLRTSRQNAIDIMSRVPGSLQGQVDSFNQGLDKATAKGWASRALSTLPAVGGLLSAGLDALNKPSVDPVKGLSAQEAGEVIGHSERLSPSTKTAVSSVSGLLGPAAQMAANVGIMGYEDNAIQSHRIGPHQTFDRPTDMGTDTVAANPAPSQAVAAAAAPPAPVSAFAPIDIDRYQRGLLNTIV